LSLSTHGTILTCRDVRATASAVAGRAYTPRLESVEIASVGLGRGGSPFLQREFGGAFKVGLLGPVI
jgi:hypothetical protein